MRRGQGAGSERSWIDEESRLPLLLKFKENFCGGNDDCEILRAYVRFLKVVMWLVGSQKLTYHKVGR